MPGFAQQSAWQNGAGIVQSSENKLFSENAFQNAVFAAYKVRGLFSLLSNCIWEAA